MIQSSYSFSSGSGLQPHLGPPPRGRGSPKRGPPLSVPSRLVPHTCPIHFRTSSDSAPAPEGFEPSARNLEEGLMGLSELTQFHPRSRMEPRNSVLQTTSLLGDS